MKPLVIGVDGNEANVRQLVGVSTYTLELLKYFSYHADSTTHFIVYLKHPPLAHMPPESAYFTYNVVWGPVGWSQLFLPFSLYFYKKINIFFAPAHYIPRFCPVPCVVTIHDVSFLLYPDEFRKRDLYQLTHWTRHALNRAQHVIAVSKTTKKDIMNWYQKPEKQISIVYNGFTEYEGKFDEPSQWSTFNLESKKYILYLGTIQPRKNIPTLIRAFELMKKEHPSFKLVIAGKKGWLTNNVEQTAKLSTYAADILLPGYVSNATQKELYQNAFAYVLPSRYEGFGIPLLEAMDRNCPVIAAGASSLPEIGSDAALYFPPDSPQELYEELKKLLQSPHLYADLVRRGKKRVQDFSWTRCGEQTLSIIRNTAQKRITRLM